jgi:hypothetical protein
MVVSTWIVDKGKPLATPVPCASIAADRGRRDRGGSRRRPVVTSRSTGRLRSI